MAISGKGAAVDMVIETERLLLRGWRGEDVEPLLAICQDPDVMRFLGPLQVREEIEQAVAHQEAQRARLGHCYWAVWHKDDQEMIGFCGLSTGPQGTPIDGRIDIGWRFRTDRWGSGFAREAAIASLGWGFANLNVNQIWSITVPANTRSWGLMERLGMRRHPELDFFHPNIPEGSPLRAHITYSIDRFGFPKRSI
jgi:RimJ/RimL family protein N-acetyltransferase